MKILAFDLATVSGWAFGSVAGVERSGITTVGRHGEELGSFGNAWLNRFLALIDETGPTEVYYEAPVVSGGKININTLRRLYSMGTILEMAADRHKVPCWEAQIPDIRTHFLGHGHVPRNSQAIKIAIKNQCRRRGWKFKDDNEADALALLDYALSCSDPQFATNAVPLFQGVAR